MSNSIQFPGNRSPERHTLSSAQKKSVVARWPIRHAAEANLRNAKQRLFPDAIRAISQPAVQAEMSASNVVPISNHPRYEYQDTTNEPQNRFEADAAREAIARAFLPQEVQTDVEEAA